MSPESPSRHLVLATIQEDVRVLSIRVLGGYTEGALGVRTILLCIVKPLPTEGNPLALNPREVRQIHGFLEREGVTHLGFYLMTAGFKPFRQLVKDLRALGWRGVILAGGVHATLLPEESLVEGADFAVQGPGEIPPKKLFEGADPATIPGLVWRKDGAVVANPVSPEQRIDLDTAPFPLFRYDRDRVLLGGKLKPLSRRVHFYHDGWNGESYDLITSRGCLYNCAYCCRVDKGPIRRMSVDRAMREILEVRKNHPEIRQINIQDDVFFAGSDEWVEEFCRRYKSEVGLRFIVRVIPRFGTPGSTTSRWACRAPTASTSRFTGVPRPGNRSSRRPRRSSATRSTSPSTSSSTIPMRRRRTSATWPRRSTNFPAATGTP